MRTRTRARALALALPAVRGLWFESRSSQAQRKWCPPTMLLFFTVDPRPASLFVALCDPLYYFSFFNTQKLYKNTFTFTLFQPNFNTSLVLLVALLPGRPRLRVL